MKYSCFLAENWSLSIVVSLITYFSDFRSRDTEGKFLNLTLFEIEKHIYLNTGFKHTVVNLGLIEISFLVRVVWNFFSTFKNMYALCFFLYHIVNSYILYNTSWSARRCTWKKMLKIMFLKNFEFLVTYNNL